MAVTQAPEILGNQRTQEEVLEGLAEAVNHRKWFASFATPYLGEHPIEIGSGFGDYAEEWLPGVERYTATEAEPERLVALKERFADHPKVEVRELLLPCESGGSHSALVTFNVLEHIHDDVAALRSMADLVRPGAPIVLVVPAFQFAMSHVDIATGHVRRYTRKTMTKAISEAGLVPERVHYVNSLGLIGYYSATSIFKLTPKPGAMVRFYDKFVTPISRVTESIVRPPFGQSVFAVARKPE